MASRHIYLHEYPDIRFFISINYLDNYVFKLIHSIVLILNEIIRLTGERTMFYKDMIGLYHTPSSNNSCSNKDQTLTSFFTGAHATRPAARDVDHAHTVALS